MLVLKYDGATGKYHVVGGAGAFEITDGHVTPFVKDPRYERFSGMPEAALEGEILRLAH